MANMYDINGLSWTVRENPEWFTRAMFGGRLVQGGYIRVLTGVKGDELLNQLDLQGQILQIDGKDCAWTPNQIIKLSEKTASVKTYKINLEQCIDELENKRLIYSLGDGANNESLPDELEEATLALIAIGLSNEIEKMIIGGDESLNPNEFNGMVKTLLDSTESIQLAGTAFTVENVLAQMEEAYDAVPEDVLQAEDRGELYAYISYNTRRKIRKALTQLASTQQVLVQDWDVDDSDRRNPVVRYLGMEFVPVKGMDDNTVVVIEANNSLLLTDMLSDTEDIRMGQFPEPNENKVWIKGRMRLGFAIPFEDEAVILSTRITADRLTTVEGLELMPPNLVFAAAGESKTATIVTNAGVSPTIGAAPIGFTATLGETAAGTGVLAGKSVTTVTVVATEDNTPQINPKTGQIWVSLPDSDRKATLMVEQRTNDIDTVTP